MSLTLQFIATLIGVTAPTVLLIFGLLVRPLESPAPVVKQEAVDHEEVRREVRRLLRKKPRRVPAYVKWPSLGRHYTSLKV